MKNKTLLVILLLICLIHKTNAQVPYMIKEVNSGPPVSTVISNIININGTLFFSADDGVHGIELWKSDGTESGTVLVKDINVGISSSFLSNLINVNGTLCFTVSDGIHGYELWKSDGTESGTVLVKDINVGSGNSYPKDLIVNNSVLYFSANDGIHGYELWQSDGTESGTVLVKDIYDGVRNGSPIFLTNFKDVLYFNANDGIHGYELWKSDGTESGTALVKDLSENSGSLGYPFFFTVVNDILYFTARNESTGEELWKSDGTASGTMLVKDIFDGANNSDPRTLTNINGVLYFSATDGINGHQLWKSDGTESGTVLVKDIIVGTGSSSRSLPLFTNVNGNLFFKADNGVNGYELWKSDGTTSGTVLVKDILSGSSGSHPNELTSINGTLYFRVSDGVHGSELWKSDGTESGTVMVKDMVEGPEGSIPMSLTNIDNQLYFGVKSLWSTSGKTYNNVLMALGNCAESNTMIKNYQTNETMVYNNEEQRAPNVSKICHCNIYNNIINTTEAMGTNPVGGININRVYLDEVTTAAYVKRHYEIVPNSEIETATGKITLYFTQEEFDEFNTLQTELLPTHSSDNVNKQNIKIELITGISSDGSGDKSSYTGESVYIDPNDEDVVWNTTDGRWEISFETTGFGGFWITNNSSALSQKSIEKDIIVMYPNPSEDKIYIKGVKSEQDYNIYNLLGKKILSGRISGNESININDLTKGIYVLSFESGTIKRIIKK